MDKFTEKQMGALVIAMLTGLFMIILIMATGGFDKTSAFMVIGASIVGAVIGYVFTPNKE